MIETKISSAGETPVRAGRRSFARDSLFLSAQIRRAAEDESQSADLRVRNLSADGLMGDFAQAVSPGEAVVVTVRGLGSVHGKVTWVKRGRIGITFDSQVDPLKARKPVGRQAPAPGRRPL